MTTAKGRLGQEPYEGMWDFDGACAPREGQPPRIHGLQETFTLGCFRWERMKRVKALKRGKIAYRVKGYCSDGGVKEAHDKARAYCAKKQAQEAP